MESYKVKLLPEGEQKSESVTDISSNASYVPPTVEEVKRTTEEFTLAKAERFAESITDERLEKVLEVISDENLQQKIRADIVEIKKMIEDAKNGNIEFTDKFLEKLETKINAIKNYFEMSIEDLKKYVAAQIEFIKKYLEGENSGDTEELLKVLLLSDYKGSTKDDDFEHAAQACIEDINIVRKNADIAVVGNAGLDLVKLYDRLDRLQDHFVLPIVPGPKKNDIFKDIISWVAATRTNLILCRAPYKAKINFQPAAESKIIPVKKSVTNHGKTTCLDKLLSCLFSPAPKKQTSTEMSRFGNERIVGFGGGTANPISSQQETDEVVQLQDPDYVLMDSTRPQRF